MNNELIIRIDARRGREWLAHGAYDGELLTLLTDCKAALSQEAEPVASAQDVDELQGNSTSQETKMEKHEDTTDHVADRDYNDGWNDCIDYLDSSRRRKDARVAPLPQPAFYDHCKGCVHFHNAGQSNCRLYKFNAWCCAKGDTAARSVGWCKTHSKKQSQAAQYLQTVEKGLIVDVKA